MDDILLLVFKRLSLHDISQCGLVCKNFNNVSNNKLLWQHLFLIDYEDLDVINGNYCKSYKSYFKLKNLGPKYLTDNSNENVNLQTELYVHYRLRDSKSTLISYNIHERNGEFIPYVQLESINIIPTELFLLKNLTKIYFKHTYVGYIPTEIGFLKHLKIIYLGCSFLRSIPSEIGLLVNLIDIDMNHNFINHIPTEIGKLINLEKLNFYSNKITDIPTEIGKLSNLENLNCATNKITIIPTEIALLNDMTIIDLSCNIIWKKPQELKNRRNLYTYGNYIGVGNFIDNVKGMFDSIFG